tara:strand:+ start:1526 stop:1786 length:261 start_codon:yes stop_codon:yes gene_type:complete
MNITTAELLDALAKAHEVSDEMPPNTYSGPEIRAALQISPVKFQGLIKAMVGGGQMQLVKVRRVAVDGRLSRVVAYQILAPKKSKR